MKMSRVILLAFIIATTNLQVYGVPKSQGKGFRISGGRPALQGEAPYQITLQSDGVHFCGATLVDVGGHQVAVTAAHCFVLLDHSNRTVYLVAGDLDLTDVSGNEARREPSKVVTHPNFNISEPPIAANDIALLFFQPPFILNTNVAAVTLPSSNVTEVNTELIVTGWGITSMVEESAPPSHLQLVELGVLKHEDCQRAWNFEDEVVGDSVLCAATLSGEQAPCHGDSGGPAVNEEKTLVGVVSFGNGCGNPAFPPVFTNVAYFVDWILEQCHIYCSGIHLFTGHL